MIPRCCIFCCVLLKRSSSMILGQLVAGVRIHLSELVTTRFCFPVFCFPCLYLLPSFLPHRTLPIYAGFVKIFLTVFGVQLPSPTAPEGLGIQSFISPCTIFLRLFPSLYSSKILFTVITFAGSISKLHE